MFQRLTIRARITIGSVVVAAVIFTIAMVAAQSQVVSILSASDASLARVDLDSYAQEIVANPTGLVDDSGKGLLVFVRDPSGVVKLDTLPHEIHQAVEHRPGSDETFTSGEDGTSFVVVGRIVSTKTGEWSLWAARSTAASLLAMQSLDVAFVIGGIVLLVAFGFASWLLASAALGPVRRMRKRAESLGMDSAAVLPVGEANDELSELATTLNAFLGRVRASSAREKQVVSDAAHELRTPLSALKTQLELAHDDFDDAPALAAQVVAAEKSVARLSSLASNLLELSRLDAQPLPLRASSADQLVSELMGSIDRARLIGLASDAEVGFTVADLDSEARYAISAENFARLIDNLLANSLAAIPPGGSVDADLTGESGTLVLRISDSGPGMAEEFLPHAFDRFSRPDDSRSANTGGSGLGLALVHAIVTAAHGSIQLRNTGGGLTATVSIPKM
ncbi:HAMP domain-containing histidine kinase [Glaciihabitans sp. INWT7]|uniref:sensor histidine kinase n=1 Tax=Glaciihabitans sp. INWT7 TaxID=2596912 RepID=UPI00162478B3|nr:HAMP domain-containing sensor histidine kinase [Glaciihabitans sp. INWT7]QNE46729.1 HAMP domain-containing histidine kinase [Glaciihabitans sp. INWT7]